MWEEGVWVRNSISRHLFGHVTLHYRSFCQSPHTAVVAMAAADPNVPTQSSYNGLTLKRDGASDHAAVWAEFDI